MIEVRIARDDELEIVHRIMLEAFEEYRGILEPPSGALSETLEDLGKAVSRGGAVIARMGERDVGSARFEYRDGYGYIGRVSTLPEARGRGVAGAMIARIESLARERGLRELRLGLRLALPKNLELYQRLGFEVLEIKEHPRGGSMTADMIKRLE